MLLLTRAPEGVSLVDEAGSPRLPEPLAPLGLVALRDELRPGAAATLRRFAAAGVRLKVISGDHPAAVAAVAAQAGLGGDLRAVAGAELDALDDAQLGQLAEDAAIFGRVTPQQKARLVGALRARGHHVAMVGDGVNDVPALKRASLAIALRGGSAAARGVADLVLLRDSFAAVPRALAEGQRTLNGLRDCLALYLVRLGYTVLGIVALGLALGDFPFTPRSVSLISLLTLGLPTFALVAWATPGSRSRGGVIRGLLPFAAPAALALALLSLGAAAFAAGNTRAAMHSAFTTALVLGGAALLPLLPRTGRAPARRRVFGGAWRPLLLALAMAAGYGAVVAAPPARAFFELAPLAPATYAAIAAAVVACALVLRWSSRRRLPARLLGLEAQGLGVAEAIPGGENGVNTRRRPGPGRRPADESREPLSLAPGLPQTGPACAVA